MGVKLSYVQNRVRELNLACVCQSDRKSKELIAEGRDISDRQRAAAEILKNLEKERELNQLKSSFISMVSHEFRNPLTTIGVYAEMLQNYSNNLTEENKNKFGEQIQNAIARMVKLLDEILVLSKNEAGKLQYQPAPLNLEKFCRDLVESFQITNSQHEINFSCYGECKSVEMDEVLLQHIFTNLLSNAIKYSPEGGNIWLDLNCDLDWGTFRVIDQGIGIPLSDQKSLFETFRRGSNVDSIQGTGLGLAIVKNCVDLHRGQIQIESEVGMGTMVTVKLPLMPSRGIDPQIKIYN
jgi:signal transduction histidine kinase